MAAKLSAVNGAVLRWARERSGPSEAFLNLQHLYQGDDESLKDLAAIFKVSREVKLRRLLDEGLISKEVYQMKVEAWRAQYHMQMKTKGSGGNYYRTQFAYLGEPFIKLCFKSYYQGKSSREDLSQHLGIKAKQLPQFENMLLSA